MFTRSPAFGLSFEITRFAVAKVLSGVVAVAVNVAVVEPAVEVRPIRTRAESAIVARRKFGPRILVPLFFRLDPPVFLSATTIPFRTRTGMGPQRELHLAHWDYDLASAGSARDGTTTCELVALVRELLSESHPAARPGLGNANALLAPRARAPPEHRGRREADETRRGEDHRLQIPPERKLACARDDADEREELDLDEQHQEREGKRGRAERTPAAVGER